MSIWTPKYGDIVIVAFPYSNPQSNSAVKARPALVVQADNLNTGLSQIILAQISSNVQQRAGHPCRVIIYLKDPIAQGTGLIKDSIIMTDKLATLDINLATRQ